MLIDIKIKEKYLGGGYNLYWTDYTTINWYKSESYVIDHGEYKLISKEYNYIIDILESNEFRKRMESLEIMESVNKDSNIYTKLSIKDFNDFVNIYDDIKDYKLYDKDKFIFIDELNKQYKYLAAGLIGITKDIKKGKDLIFTF